MIVALNQKHLQSDGEGEKLREKKEKYFLVLAFTVLVDVYSRFGMDPIDRSNISDIQVDKKIQQRLFLLYSCALVALNSH